eukprot:scaffold38888_cov66-Phaeocystis_antarctica.AAC.2
MQAAALEDAQAADAKKRKRDLTPEHRRAQSVDPEEKLLRSDEPRSRHREAASSAWTLQLPRPLVTLLRDLCERLPVEHFITVRAVALGRSIDLSGRWTVETSHESSHVLPRWMQEPALLRPEQDGELMVTMHTHPRAAITQSLDTVPSLRRRQQLARTNPLLYVPSLADVNNMLRYGMHASIVRRRPRQCPSSAYAPPRGASGSSGRLGTPRRRDRALGGFGRLGTPMGRDRTTGRPATASAAQASRLPRSPTPPALATQARAHRRHAFPLVYLPRAAPERVHRVGVGHADPAGRERRPRADGRRLGVPHEHKVRQLFRRAAAGGEYRLRV